jgi:hypothetical protein
LWRAAASLNIIVQQTMGETNDTGNPQAITAETKTGSTVDHVDSQGAAVVLSSEVNSTRVWNPLLIISCVSFGAASMLFGYDDKVISPVAAMETFVCVPFSLLKSH